MRIASSLCLAVLLFSGGCSPDCCEGCEVPIDEAVVPVKEIKLAVTGMT